ncbi:hypothetical protein [Alicyclobacillus macrosporangiidus]|uniref:hypothetical protein n=1 Tax=Alicyclobacillus macrosporangiidus TaxID=392015 RepID=UPI0004969562|nr:hypothetical protein [Alicyclobacillus macrosporangiidus]
MRRVPLPPLRGLNFITLFVFVGFIALSIHYWVIPMNSSELPGFARHTLGRWFFYLFLAFLFALMALVYTGMFWKWLARFAARVGGFALRTARWMTVWVLRGVVFVACAAVWAVRRGWIAARDAVRKRRIARMPKGETIDVEAEWLDEEYEKTRCA